MVFKTDVVVIEMGADFDPYGGEYTRVTLGYRLPIPFKPPSQPQTFPPKKIITYKHALYVIIPKDQWYGQYTMWEQYELTVNDDGTIELKKKK